MTVSVIDAAIKDGKVVEHFANIDGLVFVHLVRNFPGVRLAFENRLQLVEVRS